MTSLIIGITGQDGSYMAERLLSEGKAVHGLIRRSSTPSTWRIDHIIDKITLHYGDLTDGVGLAQILMEVKPGEIYNFGAQSHVRVSFDTPVYTADSNALGPMRLLELLRVLMPETKYYQASSSEMFGKVLETPQTEKTPFNPQSPYGIAKSFAYYTTKAYRHGYGLFATNGILFNHESPRRGETFVTQKVVQAFRKISAGKLDTLHIGNVYSLRDWGYAKDYVDAICLMIAYEKADDWLVATNESYSIKDMIQYVAYLNDIHLTWDGAGEETKAYDESGKLRVSVDPRYYRPNEVDLLKGDSTKIREKLGWKPTLSFHQLMDLMVQEDKVYAERRGST